jgi:hypothetical protein
MGGWDRISLRLVVFIFCFLSVDFFELGVSVYVVEGVSVVSGV